MSKLDKMAKANQLCLAGSKAGVCSKCTWYNPANTEDECGHAHDVGLGWFNTLLNTIKILSHE